MNSFTTGLQGDPAAAAAPNGNFMVAWASDPGNVPQESDVFGRRYDAAGTAQGGEFRVNAYTTDYQQRPQVTSDADGNFVVVWESWGLEDGNGLAVFGRRYDVSGAAGPAFRLNTYTTGNQEFPSVAADGTGRFVTTWSSPRDGSGRGIAARRYVPDVIFKYGFESTHLGAWSVSSTDGGDLADTAFFPMRDGPHDIEISLQRASDADAGNGVFVLFIDNDPVEIFGQLANSLSEVDFVRLGAP